MGRERLVALGRLEAWFTEGSGKRRNYAGTHSSHGEIRGAEPRKPRREELLVHSVNKYLMSVCYTPGTVLGDMVRMEMGNILVPGEMNILPELTSEVSYQAAVRSIRK